MSVVKGNFAPNWQSAVFPFSLRKRKILTVLCTFMRARAHTHTHTHSSSSSSSSSRGDCQRTSLTLFVPSNSEWVASPGTSNTGAKRSKVWEGQEKNDQNAHRSTVNIAVLPSLTDIVSLSSSPVYSASTRPSSESSSLCSLSKSIESVYPVLKKLTFLWLAIVFLQIWASK